MAERKAVNKYYPPDWEPSSGSVNAHVGQHPLRDRARKLAEGILIVRLELPFGVWCQGCGELLAKGRRFNAEKKKVGMYRTVPIWSFRMRCGQCSQWLELHTNAKDAEYDVVSGGRKKAEPVDVVDMAAVPDPQDNALHRLQCEEARKRRAAEAKVRIGTLKVMNPDKANADLRKEFRIGRKLREEEQRQSEEIQARTGIGVPILPGTAEDAFLASAVQFDIPGSDRKRIAREAITRPLFASRAPRHGSNATAKLAWRQMAKSDPFVSRSANHSNTRPLAGLAGIKRHQEKEPSTALDELTKKYGGESSSSGSDTDTDK
ncbi:Protein saf4 [Coemansia sp. RSA 552]|nr:Protein saf4 [Coemansia sp. RSA 552]